MARGAAREKARRGLWRLHRLHGLRERLPNGHRHSRRPANGVHHLCALHRRLRRRHGTDRQATRIDRLPRLGRRACRTCRQTTAPDLATHPAATHHPLHNTLVADRLWFGLCAVYPRRYRLTVEAVRNPTYITLSDGSVRNTYNLRLRNKLGEPREFQISISSDQELSLELEGHDADRLFVPADTSEIQRVYVTAGPQDPASTTDVTDFRFWVEDVISGERAYRDNIFNGKAQ